MLLHHVALVCTVVIGVLLFGLGFAVSGLRFRERRLAGSPDDPRSLLHRVVRAHGNTAEYAPFLALLFVWIGSHGPSPLALALMVGATGSRVLLVLGLLVWPLDRPNPLRFIGAIGTYLCGLGLCLLLLLSGASGTGA